MSLIMINMTKFWNLSKGFYFLKIYRRQNFTFEFKKYDRHDWIMERERSCGFFRVSKKPFTYY